jgi:tRNA(Ile2) C34 agmatinyltransferase TiaS
MPTASGVVRTADTAVRSVHTFELVGVVRQRRPTALAECWDCGGTVTTCAGHGFVCATCSSLWRKRWTPCPTWERLIMRLLPSRYRWQRFRIDRAEHSLALPST